MLSRRNRMFEPSLDTRLYRYYGLLSYSFLAKSLARLLSPLTTPHLNPVDADCSDNLALYKVCANDSWNLYNNSGLPFCCTDSESGAHGSWYDSCRPSGTFPSSETPLPEITPGSRQVAAATSIPTSTAAQTSSPIYTTTSPSGPVATSQGQGSTPPARSSKLSSGAIAGIAIGAAVGIVAIILLAWRFGRNSGMKRNQRGGLLAFGVVQVGGIDEGPAPEYTDSKPPVPPGPPGPYHPAPYQPGVSELST
ncbi:hypothetical protein ABW20_dc0100525 [Dactylellina cionopaga]|nr:hypothetical protein ABW20_dc0100525 [Dactylellina cionopaga]